MKEEKLKKLGDFLDVFGEQNVQWETKGKICKLSICVPVKIQQLDTISEIVGVEDITMTSFWDEDKEQSYMVFCWKDKD